MMKKLLFLLVFGLTFITVNAQSQSYSVEGNNFTQVSHRGSRTAQEPEKTNFTWTDTKGNVYPVYISSTGSCFVIKTSSRTGKEYRNYLKPDVSKEICRRLGREYKGRG